MPETTRPTTIRVIADHTPGAHRTDSEDLWWWLPIIGPTASTLAFAGTIRLCWTSMNMAADISTTQRRSWPRIRILMAIGADMLKVA